MFCSHAALHANDMVLRFSADTGRRVLSCRYYPLHTFCAQAIGTVPNLSIDMPGIATVARQRCERCLDATPEGM
jgi:hypothetical protein